jgi:NAD(P)-dependent dehydrogenase (short-subunit alcohol dehydrogenase family)
LAIQCKKIATPIAVPRILNGKTSGSMTQTVGPQVAAKEAMNTAKHTSVVMATGSVGLDGSESSNVESPRTVRLATMPTSPPRRSGLRPTRSMSRIARSVITDEKREAVAQEIPLGSEGTAEEVAEVVLFLASPRTTYVFGEVIEVNGGQLMD